MGFSTVQKTKLYLTTFLVVTSLFCLNGQITISKIDAAFGATYTQWDGWFDRSPATYKPRLGYFLGGYAELKFKPEDSGFLELGLNFQHIETKRRKELIKMNELAFKFGPNINYKKLTFGLNSSLMYVLTKKKVSNASPGLNLVVSDIESFYASLSGKIKLNMTSKISVYIEQSFINTRTYKYFRLERGELNLVNDYPRWTILGISYTLSGSEPKASQQNQ